MKAYKISFLVCFLFGVLVANDDTYVFEAKGEFAKELKELVEKHSKDENNSVNVYKKTQDVGDSRFLGIGINKNVSYSVEEGKALYMKKCASCHGQNADKKAYGTSRRLKDMDAEDIYISMNSYLTGDSFGGSFRTVMYNEAAKTSSNDLGYILAYLKGPDDPFLNKNFSSIWRKGNEPIQTTPTEQGSYLK